MAKDAEFVKSLKKPLQWIMAGLILAVLVTIVIVPMGRIGEAPDNSEMQAVHDIYLAMFRYSLDHQGEFPTGNSSTEVFQKLIDDHYITDSSIFWLPLPGKIKADSNKLKPENVCWDVTIPIDDKSPEELPLVFITGYRVTYAPGGSAVSIVKSFKKTSWGITVCYSNGALRFAKTSDSHDGSIPGFIPTDFDAAGKKYQQLTPDGPLGP